MFSLARWKDQVGSALNSEPFRAEASMTLLDSWVATSILTALALNLALGWWWTDPAAALLLGAVAAREARNSWRDPSSPANRWGGPGRSPDA
jgi:divalent metal cation (Fe/Co/Zn/Cd) transporter